MKFLNTVILIFIFLGLGLVVAGLVATDDLSKIADLYNLSSEYEKKEVTGSETITKLDVNVDIRDVNLYFSEDESYRLEYYEAEKDTITVEVKDGILKIRNQYRRWFNWGYISKEVRQFAIYLPQSFSESIKIDTATGDVEVTGFDLTTLEIIVDTGDVSLTDCEVSGNLLIESSTGDVKLMGVNAPSITVKASTGTINLEDVNAEAEVDAHTTTGDVQLKNALTEKLTVRTSTGRIRLINVQCPEVKLSTSTGNINADLVGNGQDYSLRLSTDTGSIVYQGQKCGDSLIINQGSKSLEATTSTGSININID
jgi:DUF4097 and DUF4098 domain-containing protein YvlB